MAQGYLLTPADLAKVKRYLDQQDKARIELHQARISTNRYDRTPDAYLIHVPCGEVIPGIDGDEPGYNECCLFGLYWTTDINSRSMDIVPLTNPDGSALRKWIYNIYPTAVDDSRYWSVHQIASGQWLVENPYGLTSSNFLGGSTTTTTTVAPEVPLPGLCEGLCKWLWNEVDNRWYIEEDNCSPNTSTTPDPSTSTSTTSTTLCPCPATSTTAGPTTTTTTTTLEPTTTTTTAKPCQCIYPSFCGSEDGECTYTYCSSFTIDPPSECDPNYPPGTTTTTCDCNTTTTNSPDENCLYVCINGQWILHQNNSPDGECFPPDKPCNAANNCESTGGQADFPTPPEPPGSCPGSCDYAWVPTLATWIKISHECDGSACDCVPPSEPGVDTDECHTISQPCGLQSPYGGGGGDDEGGGGGPTPRPTTTLAPCWNCGSSTTSSTTTTEAPECNYCQYKWNGTSWVRQVDKCYPCSCQYPSSDGLDTCQVIRTPCGATSTTTPEPNCCDLPDCFDIPFTIDEGCGSGFSEDVTMCRQGDSNVWTWHGALSCGDHVSYTIRCNPAVNTDCDMFSAVFEMPCAVGLELTETDDCVCSDEAEGDRPPTNSWQAADTSGCFCCSTTTTSTTTTLPPCIDSCDDDAAAAINVDTATAPTFTIGLNAMAAPCADPLMGTGSYFVSGSDLEITGSSGGWSFELHCVGGVYAGSITCGAESHDFTDILFSGSTLQCSVTLGTDDFNGCCGAGNGPSSVSVDIVLTPCAP